MTPQGALHEILTKVFRNTDDFEMRISKDCYKETVKALEKQIPKKVWQNLKETYGIDSHPYHCPTCKRYISLRGYVRRDKFPVNERYVYCNYCGQALDWSDTE